MIPILYNYLLIILGYEIFIVMYFSHKLGRKYPVAITIAGSDSGGGAGIQADLKTFAALQVHGTTAITSITAQNTYSVTKVVDLPPDMVVEQIKVVYEDMGIDAGKTGMLHTSEIIESVAEAVSELGFPLVTDPVMIAKSGARLLREDAVETMVKKLFPVAKIVTPNLREAEALTGIKIRSIDDMKRAAEVIRDYGPEVVVVKGGHLTGDKAIDIVYDGKEFKKLEATKFSDETTHGTGCSFSAAIAAYIARGYDVIEAISNAKKFISISIRYGLKMGKGVGPVNPMAALYNEASRIYVLNELREFIEILSRNPKAIKLIPEVGLNIAYSTPYPMDKYDIAAIPGRVRRGLNKILYSVPEFGTSDHLSRYILKAREYNEDIRAAMNIRYDEKILDILGRMGLSIGFYDRLKEPKEVKEVEGATIPWGVEYVYSELGRIPDVIYHKGDVGKEPMIVLLARDLDKLSEVIGKLLEYI